MKKIILLIWTLAIFACDSGIPESVKLTAEKNILYTGETLQLQVEITPENSHCLYVSSNSQIATVSETGLVKAVAPGAVNIGAGIGDVFDQVTIEVREAEKSDLYTSLYIIPDSTQWAIGETFTFNFSYEPLTLPVPEVTWKVGDKNIASFEGNRLTIHTAGKTEVWAEISVDGKTVKSDTVGIETVAVDGSEISLNSEIYRQVQEIKMNEGTVTQIWPKSGSPLWSVDETTGVLVHRGGDTISGENAASAGNNYILEKPGVGANSWIVWQFPENIDPVEYDYIEIDFRRESANPLDGYSIIFNHNQPYPGAEDRSGGISYELVHFNNVSANGYGWFISYGGMWQNVGKQFKYHAGVMRQHPRDETGVIRFGMLLSSGPENITLYYNRENRVQYNSYTGNNASSAPSAWVRNGSTVLELIYNNVNATGSTVAIEKIRLYNRKTE